MPSPSRKRYRVRKNSSSSSSSSESSSNQVNKNQHTQSPLLSGRKSSPHRSSRSTSRTHSRTQGHRHSRSRSRHHSRSRSRRYSRSTSRSPSPHHSHHKKHYSNMSADKYSRGDAPVRPIVSERAEFLNARVFVGHLPSDRISNEEFQEHFSRYGKIIDSVVHSKGYGFVQFMNESDALRAVSMEKDALLKGNVIDVKMAAEGRRDKRDGPPPVRDRRSPPPFDRPPAPGYPPILPGGPPRDRSPVRDPYIDRYRDTYRDGRYPPREPLPPRVPRDPLGPPRRDDPYYDDPYRRPPPPADPYYDRYRDDPYRRDPYAADPYVREPYPSTYRDPLLPPPPPLKTECMIVLLNNSLRQYGLSVEVRLKKFGLVTDITIIPEDRTLQQEIEDISRHGGIFAVIVNSQNEVHRSLTLNILHGTPQEHRNMPLEDALTLISSSFKKYLQNMREKEVTAAAPLVVEKESTAAAIVKAFLPPSKDVSYLLNLLADNRQLTVEELDKVIFYLRERRDKILEAEGRPKITTEAVTAYGEPRLKEPALQQQELQNKILSMLNQNGTGGGIATATVQSPRAVAGIGQSPVPPATSQSSNPALINFDNPSVQKALDNLIQSGPNLLRTISSTSQAQPPVVTSSVSYPSTLPGEGGGLAPAYNQGYSVPHSRAHMMPSQHMPRY